MCVALPRSLARAATSVLRYLLRSTTRATPFGLFAGVAPLLVGDATHVAIGDTDQVFARVDRRWLTAAVAALLYCRGLADRLAVEVDGRAHLRDGRMVLPNRPCVGGAPSTGEAAAGEVTVRATAPVSAVICHARTPTMLGDLREQIADALPTASTATVDRMLAGLLAEGFLVTELNPPMTGTDPLAHVIDTAARAGGDRDPEAKVLLAQLRAIQDLLIRHDCSRRTPAGDRRGLRAAAVTRMRDVADHEKPLGVDLQVDADVSVPRMVADEAAAAAAALVRLSPEPGGTAAWRDYHRRFLDRYGLGAVVPLPELLHAGAGLGYPAGYRGTHLPQPASRPGTHARRRAELLTRLAHAAMWNRQREVVLIDADLDALVDGAEMVPQPHTDLRVEVHASRQAELDAGRFDPLVVGASRAAGTVTGRFLDLLDPTDQLRVGAALEGLPTVTGGAVRVQLSGPPAVASAAAIAHSPALLPRQLVVGGLAPAAALQPADLAVSGDNAGLYLLEAATGRPVEPALFSALELVRCADPTLRFLCEICVATTTACSPFTWGPALRDLPVLPRLRYGRTVLSPARWAVHARDLAPGDGLGAWAAWRARWAVQDRVLLVQHDRRLGLDLSEPSHQQLLHRALARHGRLTLLEAPALDALGWIDDRAHELVLPLAVTASTRHSARPRPTATARPAGSPPAHLPGIGGWLSVRLACPLAHQPAVLTAHLPRLLADLADGRTDDLQWWFLRLVEPDHHLRLRLRLPEPHRSGEIAAQLAMWADGVLAAGLLGEIAFDTYLPETGRFGSGEAIAAAAAVFAADSAAALAQLTLADTGRCSAAPARTGLPTEPGQALAAVSMLDLVTSFTSTVDAGLEWLIQHTPRTVSTPPDQAVRARTIDLAASDHGALASLPGGDAVLAAWLRRHAALTAYRQTLAGAGIEPEVVLPDLLHLHHTRIAGPRLDGEHACLHLARAAALRRRARSTGRRKTAA